MNPLDEEVKQLLAAGQRDRMAFRILGRDPESPVEIVLFHAQQAIEKFIKAALVILAKGPKAKKLAIQKCFPRPVRTRGQVDRFQRS